MTELAVEAASSQTQSGAATPEIVPKVDTTTATGATVTGDDNDNNDQIEGVMGHPGLRAAVHVSLFEAMGTTHFMLRQAQDVLQREWADIEKE
jgi:hypothetical protein